MIAGLAIRDVDALAAILGDKPFIMGDEPCAADASVFGILTSILTPPLDSELRTSTQRHANLVAYRDRITESLFSPQSVTKVPRSAATALQQQRTPDLA